MQNLFSSIKLLISDVDGVMTAGHIIISDLGHEIKVFNVHDGLGILLLLKKQIGVAVLSSRECVGVTKRCEMLGIKHVYQGIKNKALAFEELLKIYKVKPEEVAYIGDDWQDLCVFNRVGLAIAVENAVPEVKAKAGYITKLKGGEGAVREVAIKILQAQGAYEALLAEYQI